MQSLLGQAAQADMQTGGKTNFFGQLMGGILKQADARRDDARLSQERDFANRQHQLEQARLLQAQLSDVVSASSNAYPSGDRLSGDAFAEQANKLAQQVQSLAGIQTVSPADAPSDTLGPTTFESSVQQVRTQAASDAARSSVSGPGPKHAAKQLFDKWQRDQISLADLQNISRQSGPETLLEVRRLTDEWQRQQEIRRRAQKMWGIDAKQTSPDAIDTGIGF